MTSVFQLWGINLKENSMKKKIHGLKCSPSVILSEKLETIETLTIGEW